MAVKRRSITIYRIRDTIGGKPVDDFDDAIAKLDEVISYDLSPDFNFEARLYLAPSKEKQPPWVDFLESGFGDILDISNSVINSAVVIARVKYYKHCYFAIPFGYGRYLLKRNSYQRNYGLRVALNAIYQNIETNGELDSTRIRSVDSKTVAANTLHTRRQSTRKATFETFGIDIQSDLLRAVTGYPVFPDLWGSRISGSDTLNVSLFIDFKDLGEVLKQIEKTFRRDDYRDEFSWIDNVHVVTNNDLIQKLGDHILDLMKQRETGLIEMAPPELIEWEDIASFRFSITPEVEHRELLIQDFLDVLEAENELEALTIEQLRTKYKVEAYDSNGVITSSWSVFHCLDAEFESDGSTYLLNGGDFYEVADEYITEINQYIQALPDSVKVLPDSNEDMNEGDYNVLAANSSKNYLLLDKRTVRISSNTSPIEICDVLTHDNHFIHVKRKLGSSSLSHLFAQGYVSADLFLMSGEYRRRVFDEIREAEEDRSKDENDTGYKGRFSTFNLAGISPNEYEVVYAVIAKWNGRNLVDALPFFSKVNLRKFTEDLHRMGYKVSFKRIQVTKESLNQVNPNLVEKVNKE